MSARIVEAINPDTGNIERAWLLINHFGPLKHAIDFGYFNGPKIDCNEIQWELIPGENPNLTE